VAIDKSWSQVVVIFMQVNLDWNGAFYFAYFRFYSIRKKKEIANKKETYFKRQRKSPVLILTLYRP